MSDELGEAFEGGLASPEADEDELRRRVHETDEAPPAR